MPIPLLRASLLGLAIILSAASGLATPAIPPAPEYLVFDEAGTLSPSQRKAVETLLIEHNQATGEQLTVGIFKTLEGEDAELRTRQIFGQWLTDRGLGNKGALLAVFEKDDKASIEAGYGLHALDENAARSVVRDFVEPELRLGHVFRAVGLGTLELLRIDESPLIQSGRAEGLLRESGMDGPLKPIAASGLGIVGWLLFALIALSTLAFVLADLAAAEAHFTGEGWYRPNPWKLLSPSALRETFKRGRPAGDAGGIHGDW